MSVPTRSDEITALLLRWGQGDREALDELIPQVTTELRRMARSLLSRERRQVTLQPTALVHELYLRLVGHHSLRWQDRAHFFAFAATLMRRILVDHARARKAARRGGGQTLLSLDEAEPISTGGVDLIAFDQALSTLERVDRRGSRIVELRCFAGLTSKEIAEVMSLSEATVSRSWTGARAWLYRELVG